MNCERAPYVTIARHTITQAKQNHGVLKSRGSTLSSPIGHSLAGYAVYAFKYRTLRLKDAKLVLLTLLAANLPDLDFLPGLLVGTPNVYHHGISHSLGAAVVCSAGLALIARRIGFRSFKGFFLFFLALYGSHLLLDYISIDEKYPLGIPLLWPLTDARYLLPHPILPPIHHALRDHASLSQFVDDVFSLHNVFAMLLEAAILLPIAGVIAVVRGNQKGKGER